MSLEAPPSFLSSHIHSISTDDLPRGAVLSGLIHSHPIFPFTTGLHRILFVTGSRWMLLGTRAHTLRPYLSNKRPTHKGCFCCHAGSSKVRKYEVITAHKGFL